MTSALKPLAQCCSNFMWNLLGERKIAKMVMVQWPRWLPCPYIIKTFKKSSSPEPNNPWGLIFAQVIMDGRSTKIAKVMVLHWCLTFYGMVKFASPCICMGPIHLYGKMLRIHILDISSIIQLNRNLMMTIRALSHHKLAKWADRKSKIAATATIL